VLVLLALDFFLLHKKGQAPSMKKALWESLFFVANSVAFAGVVYLLFDRGLVPNLGELSPMDSVVKYFTGYVIELSLSVDNLFVIAMIFAAYKVPLQFQHRVLFLGILGALIFRALLIGVGLTLIDMFHGVTIVFGVFLLYTAFKMLKKEDNEPDYKPKKGITKWLNISNIIDGEKFRTTIEGKRVFTALFGALISIELTDILFALDSIPAIFAITTDPYIVYSSNIFAIMGLRSLYFFLANMLEKFIYLKYSVFTILIFVALKLITVGYMEIPEWFSLSFIVLSLFFGVVISIQKMKVK
jgi:tellurite resistance protein TerC